MARKSRKNVADQELAYAVALYIRTALYVRLSVEDNKKRGFSIDTQVMLLENFIEGHPEFLVHDVYIDNGYTGTNTMRPAFQRMLAEIEDGKVNCVIVKDLSRLGRNSIDTGYYMEQYFPSHKVRFISVSDQYDSANPDNLHGGIILPLKNMINEAYSLDIGRKIKAQARQAMKDGEYMGARALYGYRKDPQDCHKLLVDEEAAAVVRRIFQWAHEKVGINDIVRLLNAEGILPPSNYKRQQGVIKHENLVGRRSKGLAVEKENSIFAKGGYTDKDAERNILANPFKRFADMQMMRHTKTLGVVEFDRAVWKSLETAEKECMANLCEEKLNEYFDRLV